MVSCATIVESLGATEEGDQVDRCADRTCDAAFNATGCDGRTEARRDEWMERMEEVVMVSTQVDLVGRAASLCSNGVRRGRESTRCTAADMTMQLGLLEILLTHDEGLILAVDGETLGL